MSVNWLPVLLCQLAEDNRDTASAAWRLFPAVLGHHKWNRTGSACDVRGSGETANSVPAA
jgi:hypothetical protein